MDVPELAHDFGERVTICIMIRWAYDVRLQLSMAGFYVFTIIYEQLTSITPGTSDSCSDLLHVTHYLF